MRNLLLILFAGLWLSGPAQEIIQSQRIWDFAPHNAFTDLVRYRGSFYCTFREGLSHVPKGRPENGKVRILKSRNGNSWKSVALLENEHYDLRDPKISVTPDNRLMVLMGGSDYTTGTLEGCLTHVSFSKDGLQFTEPQPVIMDPEIKSDFDWIWRLAWKDGVGYGVVYQPSQPDGEISTRLLSTHDGVHYRQITDLNLKGKPNEATVRFSGEQIYIVIRREGQNANGLIGKSSPPFQSWEWTDLGMKLGGPDFLFTRDNFIALGTRLYRPAGEGGPKTGVVFMTPDGKIEKILELPGGGDTSYPGMVLHRGKLYMSYYSSYEGKTSVYLAKIRL